MAHQASTLPASPPLAPGLRWAGLAVVWFNVFIGAFVFSEPAPYELMAVGVVASSFLFGLPFRAGVLPLLFLLMLFITGGMIAMFQTDYLYDASMYVAVSGFLAGTSLFYACFLSGDPIRRGEMIFTAYLCGAIFAAFAGIIGYFDIAGTGELFTRFGRARGTFEDPNVLSPFLVPPVLWCVQKILRGPFRNMLIFGPPLALMLFALLLSFSRGGWGHTALSILILSSLWLFLARDARLSMRIVGFGFAGVVLIGVGLAAALTVPQISDLMQDRASLSQDYDTGTLGRFGRHILGAELGLERPYGIGALEFARLFPEDPHNVYLNAAMSYGWLGFFSYVSLILITLWRLFVTVMQRADLREISIPILAGFFPLTLMGTFIDTDHWRHFYLMLGLAWGVIATPDTRVRFRALNPATRRDKAVPVGA
ncbi:MAG: O-antigen ligase family protein [Hyphomicrobiaceae bacterium]|nr:O-antigen ligase family protein [Hyphomicrobiaceae bacterium]